ncbi:MAG: phosphatidate cytidylyltransferase [Candidatus Krumholzibacteriota bacterium]|nr:phosphatidate cytidylyltransferase [Candidatus Krumholzibacteriota bacterium]
MNEDHSGRAGKAEKSGGKKSTILDRLIMSAIFIPCFLITARRGGIYYLILIDMIILVGLWEFYRMMEAKGLKPYKIIGILSGIALPWYIFFQQGVYANLLLTVIFIGIMTSELWRKEKERAVYHISVTIFGVFYVAWLGSHFILVRELPQILGQDYSAGYSYVVMIFALTWSYDTGAYTTGRLFGRHKLFPSVSPGKTVEGSIGGVFFSIGGIFIVRAIMAPYIGWIDAVLLAVVASVIGQIGDLVESMLKRDVDVKDSSETIPGHGGVLDRFDSVLFTAPVIYYLLRYYLF